MAKTQKKPRQRIGSSSYFLTCFGFSRKIYSDKPMAPVEDGDEKKTIRRKKKWNLFSKFRLKNREIKPAPIEETKKPTSKVENETDKEELISRMTDRKNIPVDDKAVNQESKETKPKELRHITSDRSKRIEPLSSIKEDTCQEKISNSNRYSKPDSRSSRGSRVGKFDPMIGISIIIITLVIMLIWGRLCAILCTSAWCYFLPRIRDAATLAKRKRGSTNVVQDMNSESYKRKVVLDGFLGRQNRVSLS